MIDCTAIILTFNEEANIEKCIDSIYGFCKEIVVVDSFSSDSTCEIAKKRGCKVIQHIWENYAKQFNYGLSVANISTEWILRIDADERLSEKAKNEIESLINDEQISGFIIPLEVTFLGKKLKHGGIYPIKRLSLFRKSCGYMEQKNMDEHIVVSSGKTKKIKSVSFHEDNKDLKTWLHKHIDYVFREAKDAEDILSKKDNYDSNKKRRFYYKLPSFFRAKLYFIYRYYLRLGFLDGKAGRYFALLQAYFYRVAIDAALFEAKHNKK